MKKCIILTLLILMISAFSFAGDQRDPNNFKVFSGQTIFGSGNSVYVVDLRDPRFWPITEFDFSLQISGVTARTTAISGATIDAIEFVVLPAMPSGNVAEGFSGILSGSSVITAKLPWVTVVNDMDIATGNTEYPIPLFGEKGKLLLIKWTSGASTLFTDLWLDMD